MRKHNFKDRLGEEYLTTQGYIVEIIKYQGANNVTVQFKDTEIVVENINFKEVKNGNIRNLNHKAILGVGYIGYGKYKPTLNKKTSKCYTSWQSMLARCYNEKSQVLTKNKSYVECNVTEKWHNFQNFAQWFEENYNFETMQGWCLDKDIIIKGNKIYSPETCCFVPNEINTLFTKIHKIDKLPTGVTDSKNNSYRVALPRSKKGKRCYKTVEEAFQAYKEVKEEYIKEVADKWKDLIDPRVYEAMYNYKVEITD